MRLLVYFTSADNFLLSAALDGGTQVMVFVWSFAVGGASGSAVPFPNWALVSPNLFLKLHGSLIDSIFFFADRTRLVILTIVND